MQSLTDERDGIIRDLCPHLAPNEQRRAAERFDRYVELLCRIARRIAEDPVAYRDFNALTASEDVPTMKHNPSAPPIQSSA